MGAPTEADALRPIGTLSQRSAKSVAPHGYYLDSRSDHVGIAEGGE
jgi:hypothetical protein